MPEKWNGIVRMPKCLTLKIKHQAHLTAVTSKTFLSILYSLKLAFIRFRDFFFVNSFTASSRHFPPFQFKGLRKYNIIWGGGKGAERPIWIKNPRSVIPYL